MKKSTTLKRLLLSALFACFACLSAWGSSTVTYTFNSKAWGAKIGTTAANWTSGKDGNQYTTNQGIQVSTGVTGANGTCPTSYSNICNITVSYCTNASKGAGTIKVHVGSTEVGSKSVTTTGGTTPRDMVFTPSSNLTGQVKITVNCTTNSIYIYAVTIEYNCGGGCITLTSPVVTATAGNGQVTLSWPAVSNASSYTLSWNGGAATTVTSPYTKTGLTNGTTYTYSIVAVGDGSTYCNSAAATGSAKPVAPAVPRTVTFNAGSGTCGTSSLTESSAGAGVSLPSASPSSACASEGWTFAGWSTASVSETTTTPATIVGTTGANYKPASDVTLYAVYKQSGAGEGESAIAVSGNTVVVSGTNYSALKLGTGSVAGTTTITIPSGTTKVKIHIAAWNGETVTVSVTGATVDPSSINLTADAGISGSSSTYTLSSPEKAETDYYKEITTSDITSSTTLTLTATSGKRFVIWGIKAVTGISTYNTSPDCTPCTDAGAAFSLGTNIEKLIDAANFTNAVTYINTNTGTKTYTSSDESVATVNPTTGEVTIVGVGETTITLTQPKTSGVCAVNISYTLTVSTPGVDVIEVQENAIIVETDEGNPTISVQEKASGVQAINANDIFFSKYYEAASNMKLFALYNGTDHDIDMSKLRVRGGSSTSWPTSASLCYVELSSVSQLAIDFPGLMLPPETEIVFWSNNYGTEGESSWTYNEQLRTCISMTIDGVDYNYEDMAAGRVPHWYCLGGKVTYNTTDADGNHQFTFNGDDPLSLERKTGATWSSYDMIDLLGAGTKSAPDKTNTKQISTKYVINGERQSLNDGKGYWCDHDGDPSTPELSTNRYLLIRRSSLRGNESEKILDGSRAVSLNTTNFLTLCDEWDGVPVGGRTYDECKDTCSKDDVCKTYVADSDQQKGWLTGTCMYETNCNAGRLFSEVGQFDYTESYVDYVDVSTSEYAATTNADGTMTIKFNNDNLADYSCENLKIQVKNGGGAVVAEKIYKVPLIVTGTKTTTADLFRTMGTEKCSTCDVAILKGAKLTKANTGATNDTKQFRTMEVYAGGELVVPSAATDLTLNSLILRSKGDTVSSAYIKGTVTVGNIAHTKRVDGKRYYFFVLPYNCNVSDITYYNGKSLGTRGTDWEIKYYDGAGRASGQNAGHWARYTGSTLAAGTGYILAVDAELNGDGSNYTLNQKKEVLFPLGTTLSEGTQKSSLVTAHGWGNTSIGDNHKGWNLVGVPYMSKYGVFTTTGFKLGIPSFTGEGTNYEWLENPQIVNYLNATVPYVTVPNPDGKTYTQVLASSQTLEPFKSYFVQVGLETEPSGAQGTTSGAELTAIVYPQSRRTEAPQRSLMEASDIDYVPLTLSNGSAEDVTTIIVDEEQTPEYAIGADLEKMYGYAAIPQLYSHMGGVKMAFNALNAAAAASSVPLGYYAPTAGTYTFSTTATGDYLQGVYLTDNVTGTTTNLLLEDYTFNTEKTNKSTIDDRFTVSVVRVATGVENVKTSEVYSFAHDNMLRLSGVEIGTKVRICDAVGRVLVDEKAGDATLYYNLPKAGVYVVQLRGEEGNQQVLKVVNY